MRKGLLCITTFSLWHETVLSCALLHNRQSQQDFLSKPLIERQACLCDIHIKIRIFCTRQTKEYLCRLGNVHMLLIGAQTRMTLKTDRYCEVMQLYLKTVIHAKNTRFCLKRPSNRCEPVFLQNKQPLGLGNINSIVARGTYRRAKQMLNTQSNHISRY